MLAQIWTEILETKLLTLTLELTATLGLSMGEMSGITGHGWIKLANHILLEMLEYQVLRGK